jgi:small-conductance mechanosensitive channel
VDATGQALDIFGITLLGVTAENGRRLLLTIAFAIAILLVGRGLGWVVERATRMVGSPRAAFWSRQIIRILTVAVLILGVLSIWFNDPARLATAFGLITAGLAFALQRVITATAGYFVILRGDTFNVGDRIVMGGVRGDVINLSFMQTTLLEMGNGGAGAQSSGTGNWVHGRQYTGRIVTVSNAKIFDEPVYNFTREFPYIWEELQVPIRYDADRERAETIILNAALKLTAPILELGAEEAAELRRRYDLPSAGVNPKVYWRITPHWLELSVRFLARTHGVRELKDALSREILVGFDAAGIAVAREVTELAGTQTIRLERPQDLS